MRLRNFQRFASVCILMIGLATVGWSQDATQNPQQWRSDLAYLAQELPRRHVNAYHSITPETWTQAVANLNDAIPTLPDHIIIVRLTQLMAMIGDQHTSLSWTSQSYPFRRYPLSLTYRPDGVFVTRVANNHRETNRGVIDNSRLANLRVVRIGGMPIDEAIKRVSSLIAQDNAYSATYSVPGLLIIPEVLNALDIVSDIAHATYTLEGPNGNWIDLNLAPYTQSEANQLAYASWQGMQRWTPPLYFTRPSSQFYWYEYLPNERAVYFRYAVCAEMSTQPFATFMQNLVNALNTNEVEKLIIELRGNGGGNSAILEPFIKYVQTSARFNQRGKLFVLIDNGVASSGMWAANSFQLLTNAILIGEPTGGKPNFYGNLLKFTLPNSGLTANYSSRLWTIRLRDDPVAVFPEISVQYPWSAFQQGRDPVLEAALNY